MSPKENHRSHPEAQLYGPDWLKSKEKELPTKRVLFVCAGNVGRSQHAEFIFRRLFPHIPVASAGIHDFHDKYPNGYEPVIQELRNRGATQEELDQLYVKQLTEEMVTADTDIILLCDPELLDPKYVRLARSVMHMRVRDPYDHALFKKENNPYYKDIDERDIYTNLYDDINTGVIGKLREAFINLGQGFLKADDRGIYHPGKIGFPNKRLPAHFPNKIQIGEILDDYEF